MVVEPPSCRDDIEQCRFTLYKNPHEVPAAVRELLGETGPTVDKPLGSAGPEPNRRVHHDTR